jgi:DNA-binding GntR family transcriptional regulator
MARLRTLDLPSDGKMRAVFQAHLEIVEAIETTDPLAASALMRRHLSGTIDRLDDIRAETPHFFH